MSVRHWQTGRWYLTTQIACRPSHRTKSHGLLHRPPLQLVVSVQSLSLVHVGAARNCLGGNTNYLQINIYRIVRTTRLVER